MKRHISVFICVFTLAATAKVGAIDPNRRGHEHEYEQEHGKKQKYTCPMHPEVVTDHPGNCPKCGMKLVPLKQSKRRTTSVERSTHNHQSHVSQQSHQTQQMHAPSHEGHEMHMEMHSSIDIADPMSREGSGTSCFFFSSRRRHTILQGDWSSDVCSS